MVIKCKLIKCPYNNEGFCLKPVTSLDEQGMCDVWWKNGQPRPHNKIEQGPPYYKDELDLREVEDIIENENREEV